MLKLEISQYKKLTLVKKGSIYYGEDKIGNIEIFIPDTIGEYDSGELEFTLFVTCGGGYFPYTLDFDEAGRCLVPITTDITDSIGEKEFYVEITKDNTVIGKTNSAVFSVEKGKSRNIEIAKRDELFEEIDSLNGILASKSSALNSVKNALITKQCGVDNDTPESEYGDYALRLLGGNEWLSFLSGTVVDFTVPDFVNKIRTYLFAGFTNLQSVTLPDNLTEIGDYAFSNCGSLSEITIPNSVTKIGHYAFAYTYSLSELELPSNLTSLGSRAFRDSHIRSIVIPGSIQTIPYQCFADSWLEEVTLEHGVTSIGTDAFYCGGLRKAFLPNTLGDYTNQIFSSSNRLNHIILEDGYNSTLNASRLGAGQITSDYVDWLVDMLEALADRTGQTPKTLTLGSSNLNRLTAEQKAIATNKNWILA